MTFPRDVLTFLDRTREVDVETRSSSGRVHRVPIWIVVAGDDVFARSWRGSGARWYREIMERDGALVAGARRIPVHAVRADDPDSVRRTSEGYQTKYRGSRSTPSMLRDEILETTIRLDPPA
jgi:hypothetical protein